MSAPVKKDYDILKIDIESWQASVFKIFTNCTDDEINAEIRKLRTWVRKYDFPYVFIAHEKPKPSLIIPTADAS